MRDLNSRPHGLPIFILNPRKVKRKIISRRPALTVVKRAEQAGFLRHLQYLTSPLLSDATY